MRISLIPRDISETESRADERVLWREEDILIVEVVVLRVDCSVGLKVSRLNAVVDLLFCLKLCVCVIV